MKFHVEKKKSKPGFSRLKKAVAKGLGTAVSLQWGSQDPQVGSEFGARGEFGALCPKGGLGLSCRASGPLLPLGGSSAHMGFFGILLSACSLLQVKCFFFFLFPFFFFASPIFTSLDCLCDFCKISVCTPVAVHPLLRHLVVDEVISGHEMLCVSDNVFE